MATLKSPQVASGFPVRKQEKGDFTIAGEYDLTAALASGDIIEMFKIGDGVHVKELRLVHPNLDPDTASTKMLFNVGDGADRNRFAESVTVNAVATQDLGMNTNTLLASLPYQYDQSDNDPNHFDTVDIEVIAFSSTGTTGGTIKLIATCTYDYP